MKSFGLAAMVLLAACATTPPPAPQPVVAPEPPPIAPPTLQIPVEYHKLDNGLKVVLSPDHTAPTVIVAVYYGIGSRNEPRAGFAHLIEHLMFRGDGHARLVQSNGGVLNASTRADFTNYFEIVPAHALETILQAEAKRMGELLITQEDLQKQQAVVKSERHDTAVDAASLDDVRAFFRTYYAPNNAVVVVVGDFDSTQTLAWVKQYFGAIAPQPQPGAPPAQVPRFARDDMPHDTRASFYETLESFYGFGRADLLASFALFHDDPARINSIEGRFASVTPALIPSAAPRDFALPNGLHVRFVPYGHMPKATIRLVTHTGHIDEAPNEVMLSDVVAAMMGGKLDVTAAMNQVTISTNVFSESAPDAMALVAGVVRNPAFVEADFARAKNDVATSLADQRSVAGEQFWSVLFGDHPYGRPLPSEETVRAYTLEQARAFHARNFGAARSFLYVVGRFDAAAMEETIRRTLSDWPAGAAATKPQVTPISTRSLHVIDRPGAAQSTVHIGFPVVDASHPDHRALAVVNALLGGSFLSRITSNIREQKGYTHSTRSDITTLLGAGVWIERADVTTNVTGASIKEILAEIDRLRNEPPTAEELRGIQNYVAGTFVLRNSARAGIATQLSFLDLYGLSDDYLRNYAQHVYALTPADIQRLAQTYFDPAKLVIVVVGDQARLSGQFKRIAKLLPNETR